MAQVRCHLHFIRLSLFRATSPLTELLATDERSWRYHHAPWNRHPWGLVLTLMLLFVDFAMALNLGSSGSFTTALVGLYHRHLASVPQSVQFALHGGLSHLPAEAAHLFISWSRPRPEIRNQPAMTLLIPAGRRIYRRTGQLYG